MITRHRTRLIMPYWIATIVLSAILVGCLPGVPPSGLKVPTVGSTPAPTPSVIPTSIPIPLFTVRVMTFNTLFGAGVEPGHAERGNTANRLADLITLVKQADPDLLGLQEVSGWLTGSPSAIEQFASALDMHYYMAQTWRGLNVALFSKYPILDSENLSTYVGNNGALRAVVQSPDGGRLNVVVAHLDPDNALLRACQFDKLRREMESYAGNPSILMGDLNSYATGADTAFLIQGGWELVQGRTVDNIFVLTRQSWSRTAMCFSHGTSIPDCMSDGMISDHAPVGAAITFFNTNNPFTPASQPTRLPVSKCSFDRSSTLMTSDSFDGTKIDQDKWKIVSNKGKTSQDGKLIMSVDGVTASENAELFANRDLPGDFDIQVDFQIGEGWAKPRQEHLDGAVLGVSIQGQMYQITRLRDTSQDLVFAWSNQGNLSVGLPGSALSGKFRLVRTGTNLDLSFDTGSGWQRLASVSVPTDPAQAYLSMGSVNASQGFTTYFDNFQVNPLPAATATP
jgi:endonuclease/exonuclease/phosphatase family metal-dependent hydrolase